jgi:hypothetical protein
MKRKTREKAACEHALLAVSVYLVLSREER